MIFRGSFFVALRLAIAAALFVAPASSQVGQAPSPARLMPAPSGGGSLDTATTAWIGAVTTAGGSVSTTQQGRVDTWVKCMKAASLWTPTLVRAWLYVGESSAQQAQIDVANLQSHTVVGGMTLAAGGYTSNGTTGYINSNFAPSNAGVSQSSVAYLMYDRTSGSGGSNNGLIAINNAIFFAPWFGNSFAIANINDPTFGSTGTGSITDSKGHWGISRGTSGASQITVTQNGVATTGSPISSSSNTPVSSNIFVFAQNDGSGNPSAYFPDQVGYFQVFQGLTTSQMASAYTCNLAYVTAWGQQ